MNHATHRTSTARYLFVVALLLLAGWASPLWAQDVLGDWNMTMDFNGNQAFATLMVTKNPDGTLSGKWGASDLSNVKFEGDKFTFTRTMRFGDNESTSNFAGTVKAGKLVGQWSSDRGEFEANGVKAKPTSPAAGMWDLQYTVGDRDVTAKLTISQKPDGTLDAKYTSQMGESVVSNVKIQDGKLTFDRVVRFNDQEFKLTFAGAVQGDKLTGAFTSDMGEVPVTGTRLGGALIGKWILTAVSERGTRNLLMTINPDLSGRYEFFFSEIPIKDLKLEGNQVTFIVESSFGDRTFRSDFKGALQDGTLKGQMTSERGTSEITGKKLLPAPGAAAAAASASSIVGTWEFTQETQRGTRTSTLKIKPDMTGTYARRDRESPVTDLRVNGDEVTFKVTMRFNENEFSMDFKGKLEGKTLKGEFISERGAREATGKKVD
ncbi:MAG: hypothetical protein JW955_11455 [Sedimentisphaerales bacterium]|nr:hypothetical protein [Sedimentisphaerales bacterium]